ncbi:MAG: FAD-dependent oxidoreductase [Saprospiraceae bacterium]
MAQKVIIMGAGIAGMSAAHELIDRGFNVEIIEKQPVYIGGKARSEGATAGGLSNLPGEHGFRFFPGFYRHITDTMKRIPFGANNVYKNLVKTDAILFARNAQDPLKVLAHFPFTAFDVNIIFQTLSGGVASTGLSSTEADFFKQKIFQLITSSDTRFNDEYEQTGWWYFIEADRFSPTYQNLLADGLTRSMVAARAKTMSTRVGGSIFLQLLFGLADPTIPADRVLNGPTNDTFLIPWYNYLISKGVIFHKNHEVMSINNVGDQVTNITAKDLSTNIITSLNADYYLLAVPVEKANVLLNASLRGIDPTLSFTANLVPNVNWMNGIQFFLNVDIPISQGHVIHINSEWAVTCISQVQYWSNYDIDVATGGIIKGVISVDISDWDALYKGIAAKNSTEPQLISFVYEQMQTSLIVGGVPILPVNMSAVVIGYHIGSSIKFIGGTINNEEPLLVNVVNGWAYMPKSWSTVKNLFLAGDYVRTNTNLATMEAANESARRAVNCIIDASGTHIPYTKVWKLRSWKMLLPYKWYDKKRYNKGLPYSHNYPWWLYVAAFLWAIICLIAWVFKYIFNLIFGSL